MDDVSQLKEERTKLVSINARYELENAELNKKINVLEAEIADLKRKQSKVTQLSQNNNCLN